MTNPLALLKRFRFPSNGTQEPAPKPPTPLDGVAPRPTCTKFCRTAWEGFREKLRGELGNLIFPLCMEILHATIESLHTAYTQAIHTAIRTATERVRMHFQRHVGAADNASQEIIKKHLLAITARLQSPATEEHALPWGTRFVYQGYCKKQETIIYVIEQAPRVQTIYGPRGEEYRLSLPYVVFITGWDKKSKSFMYLQFFFRNQPLGNEKDTLCWPLFRNGESSFCFGSPQGIKNSDPITQNVDRIIHFFWGVQFSPISQGKYSPFFFQDWPALRSYSEWEKKSREDPRFILSVPWQEAGTVSSVRCGFDNPQDTLHERVIAQTALDISSDLQAQAASGLQSDWLRNEELHKLVQDNTPDAGAIHAEAARQLTFAVEERALKRILTECALAAGQFTEQYGFCGSVQKLKKLHKKKKGWK